MTEYVCSNCGKVAFYDGRNGDSPVLVCGCEKRKRRWVNDGRGGYYTNPTKAEPVEGHDDGDPYGNDRR